MVDLAVPVPGSGRLAFVGRARSILEALGLEPSTPMLTFPAELHVADYTLSEPRYFSGWLWWLGRGSEYIRFGDRYFEIDAGRLYRLADALWPDHCDRYGSMFFGVAVHGTRHPDGRWVTKPLLVPFLVYVCTNWEHLHVTELPKLTLFAEEMTRALTGAKPGETLAQMGLLTVEARADLVVMNHGELVMTAYPNVIGLTYVKDPMLLVRLLSDGRVGAIR